MLAAYSYSRILLYFLIEVLISPDDYSDAHGRLRCRRIVSISTPMPAVEPPVFAGRQAFHAADGDEWLDD